MDIIAEVQLAGSDDRAQSFMNDALPTLRTIANQDLLNVVSGSSNMSTWVDPSAFVLSHDTNPRVYFIHEGAGYKNVVGFVNDQGDQKMIFPDASSSNPYLDNGNTSANRTQNTPVGVGDFVDLGPMKAGESIHPFLIPNGVNGGFPTLWSDPESGFGHEQFKLLSTFVIEDNPFIMIGVKDIVGAGSDNDFDDVVLVIDLGQENVNSIVAKTYAASVPLPPVALALLSPAFGYCFRRRRES